MLFMKHVEAGDELVDFFTAFGYHSQVGYEAHVATLLELVTTSTNGQLREYFLIT